MRVNFQFEHDTSPRQDFDLVDEIVVIIVKVDLQDLARIGTQEAGKDGLKGQDCAAFASFPDLFLVVVIVTATPAAVGGGRLGSGYKEADHEEDADKDG